MTVMYTKIMRNWILTVNLEGQSSIHSSYLTGYDEKFPFKTELVYTYLDIYILKTGKFKLSYTGTWKI